jgi:hypothetical protein
MESRGTATLSWVGVGEEEQKDTKKDQYSTKKTRRLSILEDE